MRMCFHLCFFGLAVILAAGCKAPQPIIGHETKACVSDTTATAKADCVSVLCREEAAKVRIVRERLDSTITQTMAKDCTLAIVREYHSERTDLDIALLLKGIDSMATASADSMAASRRVESAARTAGGADGGMTWWMRMKMELGGLAFGAFLLSLIALAVKWRLVR